MVDSMDRVLGSTPMGVDERRVTVTENPSPAAAGSTSENTLTGTARLENRLFTFIIVSQFPFCTCDRDAS